VAIVRYATFNGVGGGKKIFCPVLKVPRYCPLVLLVAVSLREGKALGSKKGKELECGLCYY
jgi:hypothetical protein